MDFIVHSIPVKSVIKFIMKSANEIHSEIHNEILLILVKSVEFNDILKGYEKHLKSKKHRCFSWTVQLFMKSAGAFHEKHNCSWKAQALFMKSATVHEKCCLSKDHLQGIVSYVLHCATYIGPISLRHIILKKILLKLKKNH